MKIDISLELLAKDAVKGVERGDLIVVIDAFRCSSTIITALANGATDIIPVETLKEARKLRESPIGYLLAGERNGLKPKGFNMGNSPLEFVPERVAGKCIVLTTTSGTRALTRSKNARWVLIGAFLNAKAVAKASLEIARKEKAGISIVLSGRKGSFSLEDFVCAGAIIENFAYEAVRLSDAASAARLSFQKARDCLYESLLVGNHALHLVNIGFKGDVEFCSRLDYYPSTVPIYRDGGITLLC